MFQSDELKMSPDFFGWGCKTTSEDKIVRDKEKIKKIINFLKIFKVTTKEGLLKLLLITDYFMRCFFKTYSSWAEHFHNHTPRNIFLDCWLNEISFKSYI